MPPNPPRLSQLLRPAPLAALIAITAIVLLEATIQYHRYRFWDATQILLEKKRKVATGESAAEDIAVFGTSRFYHVQPDAISAVAGPGTKVTNYSWSWSSLETYEAMLRTLIAADRKPGTVLIEAMPEIFGYSPHMFDVTKPEAFSRYNETVTLPAGLRTLTTQGKWGIAGDLLAYQFITPSSLYRDQVWVGAKAVLKTGYLPPLPSNYGSIVEAWETNGWFLFAPAENVAGEKEFQELEAVTGPYKKQQNDKVRQVFEHFVQFAEANGVRLIMLPVPNNELLHGSFTSRGIYAQYDKWLDHLENTHPNFTAPAPRYFTWPGMLADAGHVNAAGARAHMALITQILQKRY